MKLFWAGWLTSMSLHSLLQDIMGKQRYLRTVNNNWASGWVGIPLALGGLYVAYTWVRSERLRSAGQG
jgi:hypothetical protein